ncbi:MAG: phage holin family protein [Aestuariivirga sp.]
MRDVRPETALPDMVRQLARDGARWADAEFALTRAETSGLLRRIAGGLAMAFTALAILIVALVIIAQACVAAIAVLAGGEIEAGLIVGFGLLVCVILLCIIARNMVLTPMPRPSSLFLRLLTGAK